MTDDAIRVAAGRVADFGQYLAEAFGIGARPEIRSHIEKLVEAVAPVIVSQALYESQPFTQHVSFKDEDA